MWIEYKLQRNVPIDRNAIKKTPLRKYRQIIEIEAGTSSELNKKYGFYVQVG